MTFLRLPRKRNRFPFPSQGSDTAIEKYSAVLPQGLQGPPLWVWGDPRQSTLHTGLLFLCMAPEEWPTHNTTALFCSKNKTKKPKQKGKRLFGVSLLAGGIKALQAEFRSSWMAACCSGLSWAMHSVHNPPEVCTWRTTLARRLAQGSSCLIASCISPSAIILNIFGRLVLFGPRTIGWLLSIRSHR